MSDPLGTTRAPWVIEVVGPVVSVAVAIFLLLRCVRDRRLSVPALLFIATTSMFWQEFYADWGAYLYYNSSFADLPWGHTPYTTPNKPVFVIFGYGWFFAGSFPALLAVTGRFGRARPSWPLWIRVTVLVGPLFFLWNLVTADGAAYLGHWWNYIRTYGPALHTSQGQLAFLYPALPFALFAVLTMINLAVVDDTGRRWFERAARVPVGGHGWRFEVHRAAVWAAAMNFFYGLFFTAPMVLIRIWFLSDNAIVP